MTLIERDEWKRIPILLSKESGSHLIQNMLFLEFTVQNLLFILIQIIIIQKLSYSVT